MLYRIAIKTSSLKYYYLVSENDTPETDAEVDLDNICFLSNINPTHAHTFSNKELALKFCKSLPYPYAEKTFLVETPSKESNVVDKIYYRILKVISRKKYFLNSKNKFTDKIESDTKLFYSLEDAKQAHNNLNILLKRTSCIAMVYDFGPPDYKFDVDYINEKGEKIDYFPIEIVNYSSKYL